MSELVCPECGHDQFKATLTTRTEYTYTVTGFGDAARIDEVSEEVVDGGDLGDVDAFECADCGQEFDNLDAEHLVTREQYDEPCTCEGARGLDGCYDCTCD